MFASVIADGILFSLLYCTLYDLRFGVWPAFSLDASAFDDLVFK